MNIIMDSELKEGCYYQYKGFDGRLFWIGKASNIQLSFQKGFEFISRGVVGSELFGQYELISKESFHRIKRVIESRINKTLENGEGKVF